jgi:hypothetical protein
VALIAVQLRDYLHKCYLRLNIMLTVHQAFRHLNAVTIPKVINVPKNEKEDAERGN